ncbi:MAG: hypothetical protein NUV65_02195 [Candidatus Roizmanbacteria bacterium]|nr:hypothetical protein [Candidatus Roizmanbacteria bacterium]
MPDIDTQTGTEYVLPVTVDTAVIAIGTAATVSAVEAQRLLLEQVHAQYGTDPRQIAAAFQNSGMQ